jgi:hypothetical protein
MNGPDPSVHDILYAVRPRKGLEYPVWQRPFYLFAMVSDGQGTCEFQGKMRLVELNEFGYEVETIVAASKLDVADLGSQPLRLRFLSVQMPPVRLPKRGVYQVCLMCDGQEIAVETIHAR